MLKSVSGAPPVRLAIIGAGVMGRNHLRVAKLMGIEIAGIADVNTQQARDIAGEFGVDVLTNLHDLDAAVIAVPTAVHGIMAFPLLQDGVHCLVEKPFASNESECRRLIEAAAIGGAVLQVGHIERFNPAMEALAGHAINPAHMTALTARRMGPASARITDVSVVADLMVHDLDAILALKPVAVTGVEANGGRDHAEAKLTFADGAVATLTASRTSSERIRDLAIDTVHGRYHLDYLTRSLTARGQPAEVFAGDALGAQLKHFMGSIAAKSLPRVTGEAALEVMKLAWRIEAALGLQV